MASSTNNDNNKNDLVSIVAISEDVSVDNYKSSSSKAAGTAGSSNKFSCSNIISGGTLFDAIIMEAAQQVGQTILNLPWIFANMGYTLGLVLLFLVTVASMWSQNLLITLLVEYRKEKHRLDQIDGDGNANAVAVAVASSANTNIDNGNDDEVNNNTNEEGNDNNEDNGFVEYDEYDETKVDHRHEGEGDHVVSYHDLIFWAAGPWWGNFSLLIVILALGGLSVAQIISTSSNLYLLQWGINKRLLSCIVGAIVSLVCFVPTYREYRVFTILGLVATTYTAWYMTVSSIVMGPVENVDYTGPTNLQDFATVFSNIVFMFGTHSAAVNKADVMNKPSQYDRAYVWSILYVYTITIPNGISAYHTFGSQAASTQNAFYLFHDDIYQRIGIVLMCLHEIVAFGLFAGPLFNMAEKFLKINHSHYLLKVVMRYIIVAILLLIAIAFPFFGVFNAVVGAFTTTLATFIIPALVYNKYYDNPDKFTGKAKAAPFGANFNVTRTLNYIIAVLIFIFGFCFGGWGSIMSMIQKAENINNNGGIFAECYDCNLTASGYV